MRSLALVRYSLAATALAALGVTAAQVANISFSLPLQQLELAFNLTRVLIQL